MNRDHYDARFLTLNQVAIPPPFKRRGQHGKIQQSRSSASRRKAEKEA